MCISHSSISHRQRCGWSMENTPNLCWDNTCYISIKDNLKILLFKHLPVFFNLVVVFSLFCFNCWYFCNSCCWRGGGGGGDAPAFSGAGGEQQQEMLLKKSSLCSGWMRQLLALLVASALLDAPATQVECHNWTEKEADDYMIKDQTKCLQNRINSCFPWKFH